MSDFTAVKFKPLVGLPEAESILAYFIENTLEWDAFSIHREDDYLVLTISELNLDEAFPLIKCVKEFVKVPILIDYGYL